MSEFTSTSGSPVSLSKETRTGTLGIVVDLGHDFGDGPEGSTKHPNTTRLEDYIAHAEIDPENARLLEEARKRRAVQFQEEISPLSHLRLNAGMSQAKLAKLMGKTQPKISSYETGCVDFPLSVAQDYAEALGVDLNTLSRAHKMSKERRQRLAFKKCAAVTLQSDFTNEEA